MAPTGTSYSVALVYIEIIYIYCVYIYLYLCASLDNVYITYGIQYSQCDDELIWRVWFTSTVRISQD